MRYSENYYKERIKEIERWIDEQFHIIDSFPEWRYRVIGYFSVLDSFIQGYYNYSDIPSNRKKFCEFVLNYKGELQFLEDVDVITLFYHHEEAFEDKAFLDDLIVDCVYTYQTLKDAIGNVDLSKVNEREKEKHRYVELLYMLRNKLVHELTTPSGCMNWGKQFEDDEIDSPFYSSLDILFSEGCKNYWTLTFPEGFIKKMISHCISEYLQVCIKNRKDPFGDDNARRKMYFAWYDK